MAVRIYKQGVNIVIADDANADGPIITPAADMRFEVRNSILKITDKKGSDRALNYKLADIQDEGGSGFATSQLLIDYLIEFVGSYNDCFNFQSIVDAINTLILCCQELDQNTDEIEAKLDSVITLITASNVSLDNIDQNTDNLEALLTSINSAINATNVLITASNVSLDNIDNNTDNLESLQSTTNSLLSGIDAVLDNILTCCGDGNTILQAIADNTDGIEGLITASNALLTSLDGKDFATETTLAALNAKFNSLGQKNSANSHPVVLSTEQEVILSAIQTAVEAINIDTDGLATEATLAAIGNIIANIKLDTDNLDVGLSTRASESTLAAILSKIIAAPSTEAKQDAIIALLTAIDLDTSNLDVALSTRASEVTNAAILAKIIAAPATESKQDAMITALGLLGTENTLALIEAQTSQFNFTSGALDVNASVTIPAGLATEATLAAILAKIIASPSTEAKQDAIITALGSLSTEATLAAIKAKTDLLNFTGLKLRTTGEDASGGGGGSSTFGDSSVTSTVGLSDTSVLLDAADTDRKQIIVVNTTGKTIWVKYAATAVYDEGIPLSKNDILIEDKYRGDISAIMDSGESGDIQLTVVTL